MPHSARTDWTVDTVCSARPGRRPPGQMADDSLAEAIDGGEAIEAVSTPPSPCTQEPGCVQTVGTSDRRLQLGTRH